MANKLKLGAKVKVVANTCSHHVPHGHIGTIIQCCGNSQYRVEGYPGCVVTDNDLECCSSEFTKECLTKDKEALKAEIDILDAKLAYLEETEQEEGDETRFKVYYALTVFENGNLTKQEKSKLIANLLDCCD